MKEIEDLDIEHYFIYLYNFIKEMKEKRLTLINKIGKMANENIIVKFQVEGADKFNKDIEKSADVILDVAKANKIADQSSDELAKSIS